MIKKICIVSLSLFILCSGVFYFKSKTDYEHQFAVCAIFKNEAPYLKEWIDYHHHILGATKFYLYNNDSSDDYREVLEPYIANDLVELIDWETRETHALRGWLPEGAPWNDYQIGAYNHCVKQKALGNVRWVAMIDIDEFIVPTHGVHSFKRLIQKRDRPWPFRKIGVFEIHWKVFGTSYLWDLDPEKMLTKQFYLRSIKDHGWNRRQVKSLYRPEAVDICLIHGIKKIQKGYKRKVLSAHDFNINHYWTGTEKRLMEKRGYSQQDALKMAEAFNCVEDRTIFQYLDELEAVRLK